MPDTDPNQLLDELFQLGVEAYDTLRGAETASDVRYGDELVAKAKTKFLEHFISKDEVRAAIGENEHDAIGSLDRPLESARNWLRDEIRKRLGL